MKEKLSRITVCKVQRFSGKRGSVYDIKVSYTLSIILTTDLRELLYRKFTELKNYF
jgi:hypothetical protein